MTLQEIFNKAYLGLAGQKFEQSSIMGECRYRGPDGKKCAVGHLIDDAHYTDELEHRSTYQSVVLKALEASGVSVPVPDPGFESKEPVPDPGFESKERRHRLKLLNAMQLAHDMRTITSAPAFASPETPTPIDIKEQFAKVAADFNLTVPELP